jgi:hypothetical protein
MRKSFLESIAEHAAGQQKAIDTTADLILYSQGAHNDMVALHTLLKEVHSNAVSILRYPFMLHLLNKNSDFNEQRRDKSTTTPRCFGSGKIKKHPPTRRSLCTDIEIAI